MTQNLNEKELTDHTGQPIVDTTLIAQRGDNKFNIQLWPKRFAAQPINAEEPWNEAYRSHAAGLVRAECTKSLARIIHESCR
jgi:hypothetical protein